MVGLGCRDVVKYLIVKALVGDVFVTEVVYAYYVDGESPSDIAHRFGITKFMVRGYCSRVKEKMRRPEECVKMHAAVIRKLISSVFEKVGDDFLRCRVCGVTVYSNSAYQHLVSKHKDLIEWLCDKVMEVAGSESRA